MRHFIFIAAFLLCCFTLYAKPIDWRESATIHAILDSAEQDAGLPVGLSHCVAYTESRFVTDARSRVVSGYRSCGLMQLNRKYIYGPDGLAIKFAPEIANFQWDNPAHSATVGTRYLSSLIHRFGGNVRLGLIAYNWGPTALAKAIRTGSSIPSECQKYADGILELLDNYKECW